MSDRFAVDVRDAECDVSLSAKRPARTSQGWSQPATMICDKTRGYGTTRVADCCIPCASYLDDVPLVGVSGSRARPSDLPALAAVEGGGHSKELQHEAPCLAAQAAARERTMDGIALTLREPCGLFTGIAKRTRDGGKSKKLYRRRTVMLQFRYYGRGVALDFVRMPCRGS
jgi:hypothetical protein